MFIKREASIRNLVVIFTKQGVALEGCCKGFVVLFCKTVKCLIPPGKNRVPKTTNRGKDPASEVISTARSIMKK